MSGRGFRLHGQLWDRSGSLGLASGWLEWGSGAGRALVTGHWRSPVSRGSSRKFRLVPWVAEGHAMTAGNLVRDGAQALLCQPPHEGGGEELVVLAQDELGGHVRPPIERPAGIPDREGLPRPPLRRASSASGRGTPL